MKSDPERLQWMIKDCDTVISILETHPHDIVAELALVKLIENLGEASRNISDDLKKAYPDVPWGNMIGMRNMLVHEYFRIHGPTVWDVAEHIVPALRDWIIGILQQKGWS